ncbi:hypothetical protein SAMN05443634_1243 [Chishuiella changwenlii]|uniref:Uncharacterized protein n=2 Tax=Chishuiella changwenlii TaxID=1434701 RepID=A0A1M7DCA9_9FLAO|nr:hypothetical protein [Chishuiella changwenlii]SHL76839.1 hypothetical protein SAMN05443634_1243 [Chishuiella changwenlii]
MILLIFHLQFCNAQSNMLKAKGHTAAAKLFQTSTKNGTVINNAIQTKTSENVKKVFGL